MAIDSDIGGPSGGGDWFGVTKQGYLDFQNEMEVRPTFSPIEDQAPAAVAKTMSPVKSKAERLFNGSPTLQVLKDLGACAGIGHELFYSENTTVQDRARQICNSCYVEEDCLEYALNTREDFGVWGGATEEERRRMIRMRRRI